MNLELSYRQELPHVVRKELDLLVASINAQWDVQHHSSTGLIRDGTVEGTMLAADLAVVSTIHSPFATSLTAGVGFWLDAYTAPATFRVGDPAGNQLKWDGTTLTLHSGRVEMAGSGIAVVADQVGEMAESGFRFTSPRGHGDDLYGLYGIDLAATKSIQVLNQTGTAGVNALTLIGSTWFDGGTLHSGLVSVSSSSTSSTVTISVENLTIPGGAVTYGANDSAGAGYRLVRVPNA